MNSFLSSAVFLAIFAFTNVFAKEPLHLPEYIKTCPRDSPVVNSCILEALKDVQPYLTKGISQLNLLPLDPFRLEETFFEYGNELVQVKLGIRDNSFYGLRDLEFQQVRADFNDLDNFKLDIDVFIPKVKSEGRYKLQGKFLKSEFGGKGVFNITMSNIRTTWSYRGAVEVEDGVAYMKMKSLDMEPIVGDMNIYASNLFDGNEAISKMFLRFANQYWRLIYQEFLPYVKKEWDVVMTEFANRVFARVPFEEIFPLSRNKSPKFF